MTEKRSTRVKIFEGAQYKVSLRDIPPSTEFVYEGKYYRLSHFNSDGSAHCIELVPLCEVGKNLSETALVGISSIDLPANTTVSEKK